MFEAAADFGSYVLAAGMIAFYWVLLRFWPDLQIGESEPGKDKSPAASFARTVPDPMPASGVGGLHAIRARDDGFDEAIFLGRARDAYEMILCAFADGDALTLRQLVGKDVFEIFQRDIAERRQRQEASHVMLVGFKEARIVDARIEGGTMEIAVRFVAEMVRWTSAADGSLLEGSAEKIIETHDLWVFSRKLSSDDRCWRLTASDEG